MFKNFKSRKMIILSNILIIFAVILIFLGISSLFDKDNDKEKDKDKNKDNSGIIIPENKEHNLKDNEFVFEGYVYKLPDGWTINGEISEVLNIFYSTTANDVTENKGAYVSVEQISDTKHTKEEIFKDVSFFENSIKQGKYANALGEGKLDHIKDNPIIVFPYDKGDNSKLLLAYMPAYVGYFYDIQFYSNKVVNGVEERFYDYDDLYKIAEMLTGAVKVD